MKQLAAIKHKLISSLRALEAVNINLKAKQNNELESELIDFITIDLSNFLELLDRGNENENPSETVPRVC